MKKIFLSLLAFGLLSVAQAQTEQDVIYLKNGEVLSGKIVEHIPGECVRFRTADGKVHEYGIEEFIRFTQFSSQTHSKVTAPKNYQQLMKEADWRPRGYRGMAELGASFGVKYSDVIYQLTTSHGFQADPNIFIGAGLGFDYDAKREWFFMPIFANLRFYISKKRLSPFVDVKAGYSPVSVKGAYANASIGCHYSLSQKLGLNLSVGYDVQKYDGRSEMENRNDYLHAVNLKVGVDF